MLLCERDWRLLVLCRSGLVCGRWRSAGCRLAGERHGWSSGRWCDRIGERRVDLRRLALHPGISGQGSEVRILYGGSVKASNAREIFGVPNVDGALVGGASLKAADFLPIVEAAAAPSRR